jgi:hypothetical protein
VWFVHDHYPLSQGAMAGLDRHRYNGSCFALTCDPTEQPIVISHWMGTRAAALAFLAQ